MTMAFKNAEKGSKGLAKLKMPPKRMEKPSEDEGVDDLDDEGSPDEEALESPDEEKAEGEEASHDLTDVSDDDLMAEVKKRGLLKGQDDQSDSEDGDQSQYGM